MSEIELALLALEYVNSMAVHGINIHEWFYAHSTYTKADYTGINSEVAKKLASFDWYVEQILQNAQIPKSVLESFKGDDD